MRAAVLRGHEIVVDELPDPEPGSGQVLVKTLACGICGSDLHAARHLDQLVEAAQDSGAPFVLDPAADVVMGHEFCAEVVDYGPNTFRKITPGTRVCSMPVMFHGSSIEAVGYSNRFPGGFGELMVLAEPLLLPVPDDLPTDWAALTEPMAVGVHAVARARMEKGDVPLVVGCGPVGLAVIAGLRLRGVEPIVAADFSALRRSLATQMGAHVVVDPAETSPIEAWAKAAGVGRAVIYECVGVPGIIQQVVRDAPRNARIVVVGVCMEEDRFKPAIAINKELDLQFCLGYSPEEFTATLRALAEGRVAAEPLVTGKVGVEGVSDAFEALSQPDDQAKILVEPWR